MKGFLAGVAVTVLVIAAFPSVGGSIVATRYATTAFLTGQTVGVGAGSGQMMGRMAGAGGYGAGRGSGYGQGRMHADGTD